MSAMIGYRPYVVPGEDEEDSSGSVEIIGSDAKVSAAPGESVGGDSAYVNGKIAELAIVKKGDASVASIKSLLLDYDSGGKWCLDKSDLIRLLNDAGVCIKRWGICAPQGMVADSIISGLDKNGDGCISWEEYRTAAGLVETSSSLAIVTREPVLSDTEKTPEDSPYALLGLLLLAAIPVGIFLVANRTPSVAREEERGLAT